ncbi:MerR family transcriptional regulator [Bacillus thermotolerans]|nr:MerR family transcriptional regulator [Bacillus thermotolerans]
MLEEQGYSFQKDNNNWRQYNEDDIQYLKYISSMKAKGKSLDQAIQHIASLYHSNLTILQPDMSLQEPEKKLL